MCLSPVLGPARDPRWGRTEETFGEDTFLISAMARHYTWGMQGRRLTNSTVIAEPKHYAAHSIPEGGRNTAVSHVGPREMLDSFLPQFESAVRAGALSIMSAYSEYDGVPCSASHYLLTEKLRQDFGFKGFVLSDLGAVKRNWDTHATAATAQDAIKQFILAGGNSQFYDVSTAHSSKQQQQLLPLPAHLSLSLPCSAVRP
jgi:beta-glucosidase